ncbi:golvesin C-terminal-like domain-containing protein [Streptomyces verrucosisporus]|uniref:golvesin C-terminal-like domain-containing protein n=1 Tax=Streptomyces verrucosisporus TaxID=1695161 RepID=UPI0019D280C5|nr:hypothetical protein [Streptomyces verrucosisporus]
MAPSAIPPAERADVLGGGWEKSGDLAWTTTGDARGFHILTARQENGYAWRTTASLSEPGFDVDAWIGNICVTGSGKRAVVVYAPRSFTNKPELMARGGFTAVVELNTGTVTKLDLQASLSYYNPGCGTGESAVLTQSGGEDKTSTRLVPVDAAAGKLGKAVETAGQVTSAVPAPAGGILGAAGAQVVKIDGKGHGTAVVGTDAVPYRLHPDADGGLVFLDQRPAKRTTPALEKSTAVKRVTAAQLKRPDARRTRASVLADGPLTATELTRAAGGRVYVTGTGTRTAKKLPGAVERLAGTPKGTRVSTRGEAVLTETAWADGKDSRITPGEAVHTRPVNIAMTVPATGKRVEFTVDPAARPGARAEQGRQPSPKQPSSGGGDGKGQDGPRTQLGTAATAAGDRTEIVESERVCSVPRNDPRNQAMQPKPRQVEWAVDQAVNGTLNLHISRPANWKNLGMPAYQPHTLFPVVPLSGGGKIPAQVLLGITAQESNMWQAARSAVPGVTGNPLIGNYYGIDYYDGEPLNDWDINWAEADCGYGITQVTDHMRLAGREDGHGGAAWDYQKQRAVALDYTANLAAGMQILAKKWNQIHDAGLEVNNGNPAKLENWFFALWAYNSGFYPQADAGKHGGAWGLGWTNNPANPEWDFGRTPFMEDRLGNESPHDAAHPQDWPYPEKVLGFAAHPPSYLESPGTMVAAFRPAWWNGSNGDATASGSAMYNRARVKPPENLFCTSSNDCDPGRIGDDAANETGAGPCQITTGDHKFKCWWHESVTWKDDCNYSCGNEFVRFNSSYDEEDDGTAYPPDCTRSGLPSNAMIIDDVPAGTPSVRPNCSNSSWTNQGTFTLDFGEGESGGHPTNSYTRWPAKVDLHQIGGGFGGHFYFGHTRKNDTKGNRLKFTGTWKLDKAVNGPAKIMVHLPDHGAHTKFAKYEITTAKGKRYRTIAQKDDSNRWVNLGAFMFDGAPEVKLTTITPDGTGDEDVAFDAIAVAPIQGRYVEDTVEAIAYFDEDQNIDADPTSTVFFDTPFKSRQDLYDWALGTSGAVLDLPTCVDAPAPSCVMPETKAAMSRWNAEVREAGTSTTNHPDGKSIPAWLHFSNDYRDRPTSSSKPSHFDTDDSSYKIKTKATVSFVATDDGQVVEGSQFAEYDDRTADTHIPDFVMESLAAVEQDYHITRPNLNYTTTDLNEHNGRSTTTDTNTTGILPGRAYAAVGKKPEITNTNGYPASGTDGKCVAVSYTAGGSIGYRPMLADQGIQDEMARWRGEAGVDHTVVAEPVRKLMGEIYNAFFKAGKTGSLFNTAPPIWQELNFQTCSDGTLRKRNSEDTGSRILRSSFMPSQYLYRNGEAIDLDGRRISGPTPVYEGDFESFSRVATLDGSQMPYGHCAQTTGHGGNPWGIDVLDGPGANPEGVNCFKGWKGDPGYSSP